MGSGFDDRLLVRFGPKAEQPVTLAGDRESFVFAGHAFIRRDDRTVTVRGHLQEMKLDVGDSRPKLIVNGAHVESRVEQGFLLWQR
jgi:hypothetical protein